MKTVTLSDGNVYNVRMCGVSEGIMWIHFLDDVSLEDIEHGMDVVRYDFGSELYVIHKGYTHYWQSIPESVGVRYAFTNFVQGDDA